MARSGFSVGELLKVLEKSGLNIPQISNINPLLAKDQIRNQVTSSEHPGLAAAKQKYMDQIHAIAAMDSKLMSVYSDPSSKLFIEHPFKREQVVRGARSVGFGLASKMASEYSAKKSELESKISGAESLFKELNSMKAKEDKDLERQAKEAEKESEKVAKQLARQNKAATTKSSTKSTKPKQEDDFALY